MTKEKAIYKTPSSEIKYSEGAPAVTGARRFRRGFRRNLINTLATLAICLLARVNATALPLCGSWPKLPAGCIWPPLIIIATTGEGAENGARFDTAGDWHPIQMGWTSGGSTDALLARPHDGRITRGKDLFGNFAPQPSSNHPNGFLALSVYDPPENGGNGDGVLDAGDAIFPSLVLWIDSNHDLVAQPEKMHPLPEHAEI